MGFNNVLDGCLATEFIRYGRRSSLRMFAVRPGAFPLFRGRLKGGAPHTDIYIPQIVCVEDLNENEDVPSIHEEVLYNFKYGWKRDTFSETEDSFRLAIGLKNAPDDEARYSMEHFDFLNYDHHKEINVDRVDDSKAKSFIPLDIGKSYMNEVASYYQTLFGHLPNEYYGIDFGDKSMTLQFEKTMKNIEDNFKIEHRFIYNGSSSSRNKKRNNWKDIGPLEVNYIIEGGILLYLSDPFNAIIVVYDKPEQLDSILPHIVTKKERKTPEKPKFKLLVHNSYGFDCTEFDLKHFDIDIKANYNDDIPDSKIRHFINSDNEAGLCILHGKPGTGKTYYIRDLIKTCKRDFIYMNKECLQYINDSSFIAFLTNHKNSVFIMEDCENVLADRSEYNNTISTLLNLSDGLLGDSLNNKFVCTFNTDISNIDDALLRKGRMKVCYEFKYLSPDKANKLAEKLDKKERFDKDTPLCDVMNSESNGNEDIPLKKKSGKIGFGA